MEHLDSRLIYTSFVNAETGTWAQFTGVYQSVHWTLGRKRKIFGLSSEKLLQFTWTPDSQDGCRLEVSLTTQMSIHVRKINMMYLYVKLKLRSTIVLRECHTFCSFQCTKQFMNNQKIQGLAAAFNKSEMILLWECVWSPDGFIRTAMTVTQCSWISSRTRWIT